MNADTEKTQSLPAISVKKSNTLIQAIGKTSLLSNKVFLTALLKVEKRDGCSTELKSYYKKLENLTGADFSKGLVAEFSNSDMRSFMKKSGSYYEEVKKLMDAESIASLKKQWGIMVHNPEDGLYGVVDVITAMIYDEKNGKLLIKFSDEERIQSEIYNLKRNYTTLNYRLMMAFNSKYSYRIYEMLVSRIGYDDWRNKGTSQEYVYEYGLSELKYHLGILDPYISSDVKKAITMARTADDFERIEENISTEHKMPRYNDFEKYTLKKAIKEFNEITNPEFVFSYSPVRSGRGGKVRGVQFIVKRVGGAVMTEEGRRELTEDEKDEIIDKIRSLVKEELKTKEIRTIAESAEYNFEKVKKAYDVASASTKDIPNLVGFLKAAIKNGYEKPIGKKAKNKFVNFEQSEVDYDAIAQEKIRKRIQSTQEQ